MDFFNFDTTVLLSPILSSHAFFTYTEVPLIVTVLQWGNEKPTVRKVGK